MSLNLGLAEFKLGRFKEAVGPLRGAVAADPNNLQARELLGLSYYGGGQFNEASQQLELAAKADPANTELRQVLAQSCLWAKKYDCALEQFRQALRDIIENQPFDDGAPVRDVLNRTVATLSAPQKTLAELLGVSVRQLQRWSAPDGTEPSANDAARIRAVGQIVNQLRHTFTGPGVTSWFERRHPILGQRPIELLDDPIAYPQILAAATAARAMTA